MLSSEIGTFLTYHIKYRFGFYFFYICFPPWQVFIFDALFSVLFFLFCLPLPSLHWFPINLYKFFQIEIFNVICLSVISLEHATHPELMSYDNMANVEYTRLIFVFSPKICFFPHFTRKKKIMRKENSLTFSELLKFDSFSQWEGLIILWRRTTNNTILNLIKQNVIYQMFVPSGVRCFTFISAFCMQIISFNRFVAIKSETIVIDSPIIYLLFVYRMNNCLFYRISGVFFCLLIYT